jgi:hypothetical protein
MNCGMSAWTIRSRRQRNRRENTGRLIRWIGMMTIEGAAFNVQIEK